MSGAHAVQTDGEDAQVEQCGSVHGAVCVWMGVRVRFVALVAFTLCLGGWVCVCPCVDV